MKFYGDVEIRNILTASIDVRPYKKASKACISVGKKSLRDNAVSLLICTKSNKSGLNYKLQNNIERVFKKFVHEGKCTIRTKEPNHEILISKADPTALQSFLNALKCCIEGKVPESHMGYLTAASSEDMSNMRRSLNIQSKQNYPITTNFPSRLESLTASCNLKSVDTRVLALKFLVTLDLSNNSIKKIPDNWESMTKLSSLNLSNNEIDIIPKGFFRGGLRNHLATFHIANNKLSFLPWEICNFTNLLELKVSNNKLTRLPQNIFNMFSLQTLNASDNQLSVLPGMSGNCRPLDSLDVSGNLDLLNPNASVQLEELSTSPTLEELSSRAVLNGRVRYTERDVSFLVKFSLDSIARSCRYCGQSCFKHRAVLCKPLPLNRVANSSIGVHTALFEYYFCSYKCWEKMRHIDLAYNN